MPVHQPPSPPLHRPLQVAVVVFLLALLASAALIWQSEIQRLAQLRNQAYALANDHANVTVNHLEHALSAVYTLDALVQQARGSVANFEAVATKMLPNYPGVSVLIQAPGGVISHAVPLPGNEKALGLNLLQDPVMRAESLLARHSGLLTLAGPLALRQGGMGLVARLPVFLDSSHGAPAFWGFVNVVLKLPQALAAVRLSDLEGRGYDYKLWRVVPESGQLQVIAESSAALLKEPVHKSFSVPNGGWSLSLAPKRGWQDPLGLLVKVGVAGLLSLLLAYLAKLQVRQWHLRADLERQVRERTHDIEASQRQLKATLEAIPDLLFEMSLDGCYLACHAPQTQLLAVSANHLIGKTVQQALPEDAARVVLAALAQAQQGGYSHGQQLLLPMADGPHWFELSVARKTVPAGQPPRFIVISHEVTARKLAEAHVSQLAYFDSLTGLPNRALLNDRISQALSEASRRKDTLCVMFLDLDHFKNINDTLGHKVGDVLLAGMAQRMQAAVREQDTVARLGGDEFILLLPETTAAGAAQVAQKLLQAIAMPLRVQTHELTLTPSIGIALYPQDGSDAETLFKHADVAMYLAKKAGRNGYQFYTSQLQMDAERALLLDNELRRALERQQLEVVYQPQLSLRTGQVVGVEALLRWHHPELGQVSPAEFIPVAERSGQILPIGQWVLETAVAQARQWLDMGLAPLVMAVNVSAVQFCQANLPELVRHTLQQHQLAAQWLEIELTESVAQQDPAEAMAMMTQLNLLGVRLSIDDFGTGYSSLSYLKRFAVTQLKIDQSFVRDICADADDLAIVRAIISMAHSLGLSTIAEGVETPEQLELLRAEGCEDVQGYWLSRPLQVAAASVFLQQHTLQ
ncbi:EAL domain-containing protein [Rhodoferax sp.]|uniref:bifunctional diguanylate cyclase/phosphodiesterase n=1 Tax=Rhodoferax sp. TaxID=50421 RepID=UPI00260B7074|nr:EAL domain-containing protein [Rhodoferax sp.]MDD5480408.1 EAL domain-containing protein [Rhodoferax sp.]